MSPAPGPLITDRIRIAVRKSADGQHSRIVEVEAWGWDAASVPTGVSRERQGLRPAGPTVRGYGGRLYIGGVRPGAMADAMTPRNMQGRKVEGGPAL